MEQCAKGGSTKVVDPGGLRYNDGIIYSLRMRVNESVREWEKLTGDAAILALPSTVHRYFAHSTADIDWLLKGKGLRVGSHDGNIHVTVIDMPSEPSPFLDHLKLRVDPSKEYYHRGSYCVVVGVPPSFFSDRGILPDTRTDDWRPPYVPRNVKMVEQNPDDGASFVIPPQFILGYYDGTSNTFYKNPLWEDHPSPTVFGIEAERKLHEYRLQTASPDVIERGTTGFDTAIMSTLGDSDDQVW